MSYGEKTRLKTLLVGIVYVKRGKGWTYKKGKAVRALN